MANAKSSTHVTVTMTLSELMESYKNAIQQLKDNQINQGEFLNYVDLQTNFNLKLVITRDNDDGC